MGSPSDINNPALACAAPTSTPSRTHGRSLRMLVLSTLDLSIGPSCHRVFIGPEALSHLAVPFFYKAIGRGFTGRAKSDIHPPPMIKPLADSRRQRTDLHGSESMPMLHRPGLLARPQRRA